VNPCRAGIRILDALVGRIQIGWAILSGIISITRRFYNDGRKEWKALSIRKKNGKISPFPLAQAGMSL
jgi:hypothetical protein